MFRAVLRSRPEPTVVLSEGIWALSDDRNSLPPFTTLPATVTKRRDGFWELFCNVPQDIEGNKWLIVHDSGSEFVLGHFPLQLLNGSNNNNNNNTISEKPAQLINRQPQQYCGLQTDICLFAVQTLADDLLQWTLTNNGYVTANMESTDDETGKHTVLFRSAPNCALASLQDIRGARIGNALLSRSGTAAYLTRTEDLRLTLDVLLWEFNTQFAQHFTDSDVHNAELDQKAFVEHLPDKVTGNLDIPCKAALPVSPLAGYVILMAFLKLCCISDGCCSLSCLYDGCETSAGLFSIIDVVRDNRVHLDFNQRYAFLNNPYSNPDLLYALLYVAKTVNPFYVSDDPHIRNLRRLIQLYLP